MNHNHPSGHRSNEARGLAAIAQAIRDHTAAEKRKAENKLKAEQQKPKPIPWLKIAGLTISALYFIATVLIWLSTRDSVTEARNSIKEAQRQFIQDQRPIVWLDVGHNPNGTPVNERAPLVVGQPITWSFVYSNFGKSPALKVKTYARVFKGPNAITEAYTYIDTFRPGDPQTDIGLVLMPTVRGEMYGTAHSLTVLTPDEMTAIQSHDMTVIQAGIFTYEDGAHRPYFSDFCRRTVPSGAVAACGEHNQVGEGQRFK